MEDGIAYGVVNIEYDKNFDGFEYEQYCVDLLIDSGWDARVTSRGGDQGIDIIAENIGIKIVLQCKHYSKPIGNKAIQESYAGKEYECADFALVVTNNSFTKSAKELANATSVHLIDHDKLSSLISRFYDEI